MTIIIRTLPLLVLAASAGCASPLPQLDYYKVDADALGKIRNMSIIADTAEVAGVYKELGEVEGLYCDRTQVYAVESPEAKRSAVDQVKLRAALKGGDHISTPQCITRTTWDFTNNCFATVTCTATALASN